MNELEIILDLELLKLENTGQQKKEKNKFYIAKEERLKKEKV